MDSSTSRLRRLGVPIVATVVVAALVLSLLDLTPRELATDTRARLAAMSPLGTALAFAVYLASYLGRALRLAVLLPGAGRVVHLASIAARHNLLNLVLPARSGELALPWMLKAEAGRSYAEGTAALVVCRVLDLLAVCLYFSLGLSVSTADGDQAASAARRVALVLAGLGAVLVGMRPACLWLARRGPGAGGRLRHFAVRAAGHVAELPTRRLATAIAVTLGTWLATYGALYLLIADMVGPDPVGLALGRVDFALGLVGSTGLHLTTVLPVNTLGGVGIWESGWIFGYSLVAGLDRRAAAISGVVSHLAIFGFITVIGGLGLLVRKRPDPGDRDRPDDL